MFDPEFSYKEIVDNLHIDDMIFESHTDTFQTSNEVYSANSAGSLYELSQSEVLLVLNNCQEITGSSENNLRSVESTDCPRYEPTLLDEQTVNQFLLPANGLPEEKKDSNQEPELLALLTCVICNDIFTSEADLLDHTLARHVTDPTEEVIPAAAAAVAPEAAPPTQEKTSDYANMTLGATVELENDWLVCGMCERVLSTATLDTESTEHLCCSDETGKTRVVRRGLLTMYVCDLCCGLFADGEALDRHKAVCEPLVTAPGEDDCSVAVMDLPGLEHTVCCTCDLCGQQYASAEDLKAHDAQSHAAQPPPPALPPPTGRRSYVRNNSNKMWNCGSCNQLFATARELYKHKRGEDRPAGAPLTAYVCEECDKVLGSMCALHTHRKMHKVTKPGYPCRICGRRFNQSGHLAIHMRMHTGERPYPCDLCPKAFKVKVERDDHRRTHTGERPFACPACPKTFTAAARLREHARIHTDQRPYKCDICGAAFRRPYARTVHTLIHTGEKPHECDICKTAFRRSGDMWKHKRTIHGAQMEEEMSRD